MYLFHTCIVCLHVGNAFPSSSLNSGSRLIMIVKKERRKNGKGKNLISWKSHVKPSHTDFRAKQVTFHPAVLPIWLAL